MPRPLGRAATLSDRRTPLLVREHLEKLGEEGDYVSSIHQAVKAMLRARSPGYHWPRKHSFHALVGRLLWIGLVEKTERREDPEGRGAGVLGTERGWRQKTWVRLAPGREEDPAWNNPMAPSIEIVGAEPELQVPPTPGGRPRIPAGPTEEAAVPDLSARIARLERARLNLVQQLTEASESGTRVEIFRDLHQAATRFLGNVAAVYDRVWFPDAPEAMDQLASCIEEFRQERALTQRRVLAMRNCQSWARLLGEAFGLAIVWRG